MLHCIIIVFLSTSASWWPKNSEMSTCCLFDSITRLFPSLLSAGGLKLLPDRIAQCSHYSLLRDQLLVPAICCESPWLFVHIVFKSVYSFPTGARCMLIQPPAAQPPPAPPVSFYISMLCKRSISVTWLHHLSRPSSLCVISHCCCVFRAAVWSCWRDPP